MNQCNWNIGHAERTASNCQRRLYSCSIPGGIAPKLEPAEEGLYRLKAEHRIEHSGVKEEPEPPRFIISSEISSIYKDKGRVRKIHNVILMPSIEAAEMLSQRLEALGCNLKADGRPIIGLSSHDSLELTLEVCDKAIFYSRSYLDTTFFTLWRLFRIR